MQLTSNDDNLFVNVPCTIFTTIGISEGNIIRFYPPYGDNGKSAIGDVETEVFDRVHKLTALKAIVTVNESYNDSGTNLRIYKNGSSVGEIVINDDAGEFELNGLDVDYQTSDKLSFRVQFYGSQDDIRCAIWGIFQQQ